jgi:D-glycero-alpha-D-manno-heptose-7-phosphate kinase
LIISQTPLRVSFAGGGTDLKSFYSQEDGMVTSSAIDKYIYVIIKERFDDLIYINYSKKEIVHQVNEIQHDLVRECMKLTGLENGIEITTLADIPADGSGLGSSSSVTVGLLNALYAFQGDQVSAETLAQQACHVEIDILGKPIGKQDQYIAAYGGIKFFKFQWNENVVVEPIKLNDNYFRLFSSNLLLFFTGLTRDANKILIHQQKCTSKTAEILKRIKLHANLVRASLESGQFDIVGELLNSTWLEKKQIVNSISNPTIDLMYQKALDAGAIGGKICGAGAGGFLLLYVEREKQTLVRKALAEYRELPFFLERHGSKIIFNQRGYPWK